MPAFKPEDADWLVCEALNVGDLDATMALYEPGASWGELGQIVTGTEAIREVMSSFIAMKGAVTLQDVKAVQSGDIALLYSTWSYTGTGADGSAISKSGQGREVVRRQPDGTWRFIIDDPNSCG